VRPLRHTTIAAAALLAAAIVVGGCSAGAGSHAAGGSSGSSGASGASGVPSAARAVPAPTVAEGDTVAGADLADRIGAAMTAARTGRATITVGGSDSHADLRYSSAGVEEHLVLPVEDATMDVVLVGGALYVSGMPDQATPWIRLDPAATGDSMGRFFVAALRTGFTDPATLTAALTGRTATVTDATTDRVSYSVRLDPRSLLEGSAFGLEMPVGSSVEATFVLDARDRPITAVMTVAGLDVSAAYTDWGTKVDIAAPPDSQVGPFEAPAAD